MKQQINLYKYLPTVKTEGFSQKTSYFIYGFLILLLLINFSHSLWTLHREHQKLDLTSVQLKEEEKQLKQLTQQYPMIDPKNLQGSVQELKKQLTERIKLASLLSENQGYSLFLKKLSQTILPTVWLNEILIQSDDQRVTLRGFSLQALTIQLFLDNLNRSKSFENIMIDLQNITKIKDQQNHLYLSFEASNKIAIQK